MKWIASLIVGIVVLAFLISAIFWGPLQGKSAVSEVPLPPSTATECDQLPFAQEKGRLVAGEMRRYCIYLDKGEVVDAVVEQEDVDVEVNLKGPGKKLIFSVDSPTDDKGTEEIFLLAESSGEYILEVKGGDDGAYRIWGREIRRADSRDRIHAAAEKDFHLARESRDKAPYKALERFKKAASLWEQTKNIRRRANALDLIGEVYAYESIRKWEEALNFCRQARELYRSLHDEDSQVRMLNSEGLVLKELGKIEEAEESFNQAILLGADVPIQRAAAFYNRGVLRRLRGESLKALDDFEVSLSLWGQGGSLPNKQAEALDNILHLHAQAGHYRTALDRAGEVVPRFLSPDLRARIFTRLAEILRTKGDLEAAESYADRALNLRRQGDDREGTAKTLVELSLICRERGNFRDARAIQEEALLLFRNAGDSVSEAAALVNLGMILYDQQDFRQAKDFLEDALRLARKNNLREVEAAALYTLALLEYRQGHREAAKRVAKETLELVDSDDQHSLADQYEEPYLTARNGIYDLLMELTIARPLEKTSVQDLRLAFEVSERSRRRNLLEGMSALRFQLSELTKASPDLLERRWHLESALRGLQKEEQQLERDEQSLDAVQEKMEKVLEDLNAIDSRIRVRHSWYPLAKRTTPVVMEEALALLDDDTTLLVYELMADRSVVFVLTKTTQDIFELPPASVLEQDIENFVQSVSNERASRSRLRPKAALARKLSEALLPFADRLSSSRLVIVPDGAIHEIPFAALPHPQDGGLLVQRHEIVLLPSVSVQRAIRQALVGRKAPERPLAIFAVSDFPEDLPDLEHSIKEAQGIRAIVGKTRLPPFVALGPNATRGAVKSGRLSEYRVIHLATHAESHRKHPELSRIILADGDLTAREIQDLELRADLVVLSACETARGIEVKGEGQVGLAHAFLYAGAARVVASLWKVDDEATSHFMQRFYDEMYTQGRSPAEALRSAQLWMSKSERWSSPYYWAGFQLIGEWR